MTHCRTIARQIKSKPKDYSVVSITPPPPTPPITLGFNSGNLAVHILYITLWGLDFNPVIYVSGHLDSEIMYYLCLHKNPTLRGLSREI